MLRRLLFLLFIASASAQTVSTVQQSGSTVTAVAQANATVTMVSVGATPPTPGALNIGLNVLQSPGNTGLPWWNNAAGGVVQELQTRNNAQVSGVTIQVFDSDFDPMQVGTINVTNGAAAFSLTCNNANDDSFDGCAVLSSITAILVRDTTNGVTIEEELNGPLACVSLNCTGTFTALYPGPTNASAAYSGFNFTWTDSLAASWSAAGKYVDLAGPQWVSFSAANNCQTASGNSYNYAGSSSSLNNCGMPAKMANLLTLGTSAVNCFSSGNLVYTPDWLNATFQTYYQASMWAQVAHYARNPANVYIRPAFGHGGETLPSNVWNVSGGSNAACFAFWQSVLGSSSQATQTANWNTNWIAPQLTYAASVAANVRQQLGYAPALTIGVTPMGVPNTQLPNLAAPEAQALGIGFGSQGLEASDITGYPNCTANWCGLFAEFENTVSPLELQTLNQTCPPLVTCSGTQLSTGPLAPLLAFASPLGMTNGEFYYQDWLDAFSPQVGGYCPASNGANYTALQCATIVPNYRAAFQATTPTPSPVTGDAAVNVLQAPSLGSLTGNGRQVTDQMIAGAVYCRMTDTTTQSIHPNFTYSVPWGGSADNNIASLFGHFFAAVDSGSNGFLRFLNWGTYNNKCNSMALYPNLDPSNGNLLVNAGEFSYTNDLLYYDHGSLASPEIVQYNLTGYATPSITAPSTLPVQTELANFLPIIGTTPTWQTLGGMDRNDGLNALAFHLADAFSTTGGQNTGVLALAVTTNAVAPSLTSDVYYAYNTGTGVVTEYTNCNNSTCGTTTVIGTIAIDDRFCIHNLKYHGYLFPAWGALDPYAGFATITSNTSGLCASVVAGNNAGYYFWQIGTTNVIPCVACAGHETELGENFVAALSPSGQAYNFGLIPYATAGAGIVNTNSAGTLMTFVSGVPPNASMTGRIAICPTSTACGLTAGVTYPLTGCTSTTCTIVGGPANLTGVRYNWPVSGAQNSGAPGATLLLNYPSQWAQPSCLGGSFPYSNQPCTKAPNDSHLSANANPGNDTGVIYYSTTSINNTNFPRIVGMGTLSGSTFTSSYGGAFTSAMVGGNLIVNAGPSGENCTVASFISSAQVTVSGCAAVAGTVPYYLTIYPGCCYDEAMGVVAGGVFPASGFNYRIGYSYNSTFNPGFSTQNSIGSNGRVGWYFISTDWQCGFGTTAGNTLTYCPTDWPGDGTVLAASALILPLAGNAGKYIFQTTGSCTIAGSEPATWNQTIGGTSADSGCTYTNIGQARGDVVAIKIPQL
jgi:hypothetical protein